MGPHETHNPQGSSPPINESLIIDTVRIEAERQRQEQAARDEQNRQRQATHDRNILLVTIGLLVATWITGIAALYQAHSSSLNAAAAIQAVNLARDARDDSDISNFETLLEMRRQGRAIQRSAGAADQTVKDNRNAFIVEQRPYMIAAFPPTFISGIAVGDDIKANVTYKNIGKTAAVNVIDVQDMKSFHATKSIADVQHFTDAIFMGFEERIRSDRAKMARFRGAARDVAPEQTFFATNDDGFSLNQTDTRAVLDTAPKTRGSVVIFYLGLVNYFDVYGRSYSTEFCTFFFGNNLQTWHACDYHNAIK